MITFICTGLHHLKQKAFHLIEFLEFPVSSRYVHANERAIALFIKEITALGNNEGGQSFTSAAY